MKFVLNRDKVITSKLGHAIGFVKGQPTHVPKGMWNEVLAVGAVPEDDLPEAAANTSKEPQDPGERQTMIFAAFEALVLGGKRESFSGTGVPHAKALAAQIGFIIDNKERDALWQEFKQLPTEKE